MENPAFKQTAAWPLELGGWSGMIYRCLCKSKKLMKIVLDGGSRGDYELDLCRECYSSTALRFYL